MYKTGHLYENACPHADLCDTQSAIVCLGSRERWTRVKAEPVGATWPRALPITAMILLDEMAVTFTEGNKICRLWEGKSAGQSI